MKKAFLGGRWAASARFRVSGTEHLGGTGRLGKRGKKSDSDELVGLNGFACKNDLGRYSPGHELRVDVHETASRRRNSMRIGQAYDYEDERLNPTERNKL
jgi:hypothetical protein